MVIRDTLQTFPSFIYLIPVVMLFKVGDLAAIVAIIAYASVPMIRFTNLDPRGVPSETREAAIQSGCTAWQMLRKVELPITFPQIMLGINQTILMALIMVAITSLIGTKDLGAGNSRGQIQSRCWSRSCGGYLYRLLGDCRRPAA